MLATVFLSQVTLQFVILGLATGALTGLVGLGVVLVHRASGVLNFAAGALGGVGAFVCYSLRDDHGFPAWAAVTVGLAVGAGSGVLLFGVMASIRRASLLAKLIATLALFSAAQGLMVIVWGTSVTQPAPFLPSRIVKLTASLRVGEDRLILIVFVLVLAVVLRFVYAKTDFGRATSAVAENRRVAAAAGWSPARIELINFTVAGMLSALASILLAPIVTLTAAVLSVSILGALAAALVGRFSSFGITVGVSLLIGVVQSELSLFQPDLAKTFGVSEPSLTGLPQVAPLVVILMFVILAGKARPSRGETTARLPLPGGGRVSLVPLIVGCAAGAVLIDEVSTLTSALTTTFAVSILVCSIVVVSGFAGQLSLCQYALGGFGAWIAARLVSSDHVPFEAAVLIGVAITMVAGVVVALPALRTRGVNLAVATLALALLFNAVIFTNAGLTGGIGGLQVKPPDVAGLSVDPINHPQRYAGLVLVAFALTGLVVANLRRGRTGRRMLAVRSNERAAAALGISVTGVKIYAFAIGAGMAALGGILLAFQEPNISFQSFDVFGSILLVQDAVIGGLGWVSGAAAGAAGAPGGLIGQIVNDRLPSVGNVTSWLAILAAIGVIVLLRRAPDGLASLWSNGRLGRLLAPLRIPKDTGPALAPGADRDRPAVELEVSEMSVHFGGVTAVDNVSLFVRPGEIVGLIGPNGAGKTTLIDVITGFTTADRGSVRLDGVDVTRWSPERRARAGMARSWQAIELFQEMSVRDNLLIGCDRHERRPFISDLVRPGRQPLTITAQRVIEDFGLTAMLDQKPAALPQGHRRLVGIARAIVGQPAILLLDEPAAGLGTEESRELEDVIKMIASRHGIGILVVEHDVPLLLSVCDRIVALDFGRKIADGTPADIQRDDHVIRAYLGEADPVPAAAE